MAKRPSYRSIRLRQRNIVEGLASKQIKYSEAAKQLGVTKAELQRFLEQKPQTLHQNYNRSPSYKKLFESGARPKVREELGLKRVRVIEYHERDTKAADRQYGRMIQRYYNENGIDRIKWSVWTWKRDMPNSMDAIKLLYTNGRLSKTQYASAVAFWKKTYNVSDDYAARYEDLIETTEADEYGDE